MVMVVLMWQRKFMRVGSQTRTSRDDRWTEASSTCIVWCI